MLASITRINGTSSRYSRPLSVQIPSGRVGGGGIDRRLEGATVGSVVGSRVGNLLGLVDGGEVGEDDGAALTSLVSLVYMSIDNYVFEQMGDGGAWPSIYFLFTLRQ